MDLIVGRDFLQENDLTLIFRPANARFKLFAQLLPQTGVCYTSEDTESIMNDCVTDFGPAGKTKLKSTVLESLKSEIKIIDDNYCVSVKLKDNSTYTYAPRKFALKEREQIREIMDDLEARGIIRKSTSTYCARVVPVRKKNGTLRFAPPECKSIETKISLSSHRRLLI